MTKRELEKRAPKLPCKETDRLAVEYVSLIYNGMDKYDAYKEIFPDRFKRIKEKAIKDRRNVRHTVSYAITQYEQGKYVQSLYSVGADNYFTKFIAKKTSLLEEMYNIGMDKDEEMKNRLVASKIFLSSVPDKPTEIKHTVEVDVKNDFLNKLEARQKQLYSLANKETDILDAEVE